MRTVERASSGEALLVCHVGLAWPVGQVADASIMPDIVRANTHLASIVIGENAAKKILAGRQLARAEAEGEGEQEEEVETAAATTTARL